MREYPKFYNRYQESQREMEPSEDRSGILSEFKEYLQNYLYDLSVGVMTSFEIEKSVIDNKEKKSHVYVNIRYQKEQLEFYNRYIFYLYQKNDRWYVYSYRVENITF